MEAERRARARESARRPYARLCEGHVLLDRLVEVVAHLQAIASTRWEQSQAEPSLSADVAGVSPSPGADVAGASLAHGARRTAAHLSIDDHDDAAHHVADLDQRFSKRALDVVRAAHNAHQLHGAAMPRAAQQGVLVSVRRCGALARAAASGAHGAVECGPRRSPGAGVAAASAVPAQLWPG